MYLASLFLNGCRMHHIFVSAIFQAGLAQNDFCEANGSWNSWCHHWDLAEEMSGALEDKPERWRATSTFRYDTSTLWEFKWFFLSYVATNMGPISVPYRWLTRLFWEVHGEKWSMVPGCSDTSHIPLLLLQCWPWCGYMAKPAGPLEEKAHATLPFILLVLAKPVGDRVTER